MESIFIELLNMSFNASYVVLAVIILRLIFRRVPKWIHCAMWVLVAFRLICPFSFESKFSIMPSENIVSQSVASSEVSERTTAENTESISTESSGNLAEQVPSQQSAAPLREQITPKRSVKQNVIHYCAYVWIIGMAMIAVYSIVSYAVLRRRVSEAVRMKDNIYQCDRITSPFMMGIIRPKIYLPFGLSEQNMKYVIAHEQAHICRRDNLVKLFAFALTGVYWFNPIIWLAYILLCRDIELACDESVIRDKDKAERKAYSMALLECSADNSMKFIYNASPVAFGEIGVKQRVVNVIKNKKTAVWVICAAVAACVAAAVLLLTNPKSYSVKVSEELDNAIAQAIFDYNKVSDSDVTGNWNECFGEGHTILGVEENDNDVTVYALYSYYGYTFMNGNLVSSTGYSLVPTAINFGTDESGNYIYKSYDEPEDGELYVESLRVIFPKNLAEKVLNISVYEHNNMVDTLNEQCHEYAKAYLKKIGRDAKVGDYSDFEFKILSDYGVSDEVSNAFLELFPEYDIYVGNFEKVENGVRYIYEQKWSGGKDGNGVVRFHKYEYESGKTIESFNYKVTPTSFKRMRDSNKREVVQYYESWDWDNNVTVYMADDGNTYRYKLTLTGTMPNAVKSSSIVVLTNNKNLNFDDVMTDMLSSQYTGKKIDYYLLELD